MAGSRLALLRNFDVRHKDNIKAIEGFAFSCIGLTILFIMFHLIRSASHGLRPRQTSRSAVAAPSSPIRYVSANTELISAMLISKNRAKTIHSFIPLFSFYGPCNSRGNLCCTERRVSLCVFEQRQLHNAEQHRLKGRMVTRSDILINPILTSR